MQSETRTCPALPECNAIRWTPRRKQAVVLSIQTGLLGRDEALAIYRLSAEELDGWIAAYRERGLAGLACLSLAHRPHAADETAPRVPPQEPRITSEEKGHGSAIAPIDRREAGQGWPASVHATRSAGKGTSR